jgi:hypothetical protein
MTTDDVLKKPAQALSIPVREVSALESIVFGFRTAFFTTSGQYRGGAFGGCGFGSPWVHLEWKGRMLGIHTGELLATWVETFNLEDAAAIREAFKLEHIEGGVVVMGLAK